MLGLNSQDNIHQIILYILHSFPIELAQRVFTIQQSTHIQCECEDQPRLFTFYHVIRFPFT